MIGKTLSHFTITAKLGEGGMGEVYRATDTRLNRTVAIKVLRPQLLEAVDARKRFEREAQAVASLNHPHICTLYDIGCQDDTAFIVMEHLDGEVLSDRLEKGALPLEQALRRSIEIADALNAVHRIGMVHRDLKPGNIMLTEGGIKLMDFGLAKMVEPSKVTDVDERSKATTLEQPLTKMGAVIGTIPYMAPEQLEGKETDVRTDIFALGSVMYEMVTGQRAFASTSQAGLISAILTVDPPSVADLQPQATPLLDHLIHRCLAKEPAKRWNSTRDLAGELEWIAGAGREGRPRYEQPVQSTRSTSGYRIEYIESPDGAGIAAARGGRRVDVRMPAEIRGSGVDGSDQRRHKGGGRTSGRRHGCRGSLCFQA